MRISGFEWDSWNIAHIDRHGVTPQEVGEACYNQPLSRKSKQGIFIVYGQTDAGRYLFIVLRYKAKGIVYIISARAMTNSEQRYYKKRR